MLQRPVIQLAPDLVYGLMHMQPVNIGIKGLPVAEKQFFLPVKAMQKIFPGICVFKTPGINIVISEVGIVHIAEAGKLKQFLVPVKLILIQVKITKHF